MGPVNRELLINTMDLNNMVDVKPCCVPKVASWINLTVSCWTGGKDELERDITSLQIVILCTELQLGRDP